MDNAPIFIIDDDIEELQIVQEIWSELNFKNRLEVFSDVGDLISRLKQEDITPFLIISEVHLPGMNGFELCQKLAQDPVFLNKNFVFLFWSIAATKEIVKKAYECGGHGFFIKGRDYYAIKDSLNIIMSYWKASEKPNFPISIVQNYKENRA